MDFKLQKLQKRRKKYITFLQQNKLEPITVRNLTAMSKDLEILKIQEKLIYIDYEITQLTNKIKKCN